MKNTSVLITLAMISAIVSCGDVSRNADSSADTLVKDIGVVDARLDSKQVLDSEADSSPLDLPKSDLNNISDIQVDLILNDASHFEVGLATDLLILDISSIDQTTKDVAIADSLTIDKHVSSDHALSLPDSLIILDSSKSLDALKMQDSNISSKDIKFAIDAASVVDKSALLDLYCSIDAIAQSDAGPTVDSNKIPDSKITPDSAQVIDSGPGIPGIWKTVSPGVFKMGSPYAELCRKNNERLHQVSLTNKFEISDTEVTQAQFKSIMGYSPSFHSSCGSDCPVEKVNWHESVAYCNSLSKIANLQSCYNCNGTGVNVICQLSVPIYGCKGYRLPTEAEWEYSYRAGTTTAFYNGNITKCSGVDLILDKIGWYWGNAGTSPRPVSQKQPNAWGLYDMAGNVSEWVHDSYQIDLGQSDVINPIGSGPVGQVYRGGFFAVYSDEHRAAYRTQTTSTDRVAQIGFRCVRTIP